jgi:3-isopropylmalate/(R)-2-methylmalate dehydratase small subunit
MALRGRAFTFGDNLDTDSIVPGKYLKLTSEESAPHVMEGVRPGFATLIQAGDMVVGGRNFGCGSSRETAPGALRKAGISAVIATSYARIFFRNSINLGLPVLTCARAGEISEGDALTVDMAAGSIRNETTGADLPLDPLPPHILEILDAGGLVPWLEVRRRTPTRVDPDRRLPVEYPI